MSPEHGPRASRPAADLAADPDDAEGESGGPPELFSWLPRLSARQIDLGRRVARWNEAGGLRRWIAWLNARVGSRVVLGPPELVGRGSGLRRPGLVAQFWIPAWNTRAAIGLEIPLAHAVVDGLLSYERPLAESRLQLTPVEWGVWSYLAILALAAIEASSSGAASDAAQGARVPAGLGPLLDRVGPDPFDPTGLGAIVTVRWPVQVGATSGTARLWIAESALARAAPPGRPEASGPVPGPSQKAREFASAWVARAGFVEMPHGLTRLRAGAVLPLTDSRLGGTPQSPLGPVALLCELAGAAGRFVLPAEPVAGSSGRLVRPTGPLRRESASREPLTLGINQTMTPNPDLHEGSPNPDATPTDIPVTLAVELGRLNLTLGRLADLRPGDVLELGRHSREPVELTSNGRLVARGELVLIDTELGVRVTHVFL